MNQGRHIQAGKLPDGTGYQVSYEVDQSRKVQNFKHPKNNQESPPHGAGSFHDPEHHHELMDRLSQFVRGSQSSE